MNVVTKILAVPTWITAVLAFITAIGRLPDFLGSLYGGESWRQAFRAMAARPIPVDLLAIGFWLMLVLFFVIQAIKFRRGMLRVLTFSAAMSIVVLCIVALLEFLGWAARSGLLPFATNIAMPILAVLLLGSITGLSVVFYWGLRNRVSVPNGLLSYPLYSSVVWANVAMILVAAQVAVITAIRLLD